MELVLTLAICIMASFLFTWITKKLNLSVIIGLIIGGILIGSPYLKDFVLEPNTNAIMVLGDVGLIFLMFLTGMEISWKNFLKESKDAAIVSFSAALTSFFLGTVVFFFVFGLSLPVSLTIGIAMSITAEAANARVLLELKKLKTKLGSLMMEAGVIDDVLGIGMFIIVGYLFTSAFVTREFLALFISIAAFFAGIMVNKSIGRESRRIRNLETFLLYFIVPFLFIAMGIDFSLQSLTPEPLVVTAVILIAITGKILGSMATKPLLKITWRQLYLVGWGMNARGAIGLAIAFVAFNIGLLDTGIYSSLVIMALVTTLIFPFFVRRMVKKDLTIME
jgi:Kef-type K+ transport system membrane component KefB